jgi:hypothetical protein
VEKMREEVDVGRGWDLNENEVSTVHCQTRLRATGTHPTVLTPVYHFLHEPRAATPSTLVLTIMSACRKSCREYSVLRNKHMQAAHLLPLVGT